MTRCHTLRIAIRKFPPFEEAIQREWDLFCAETGCTMCLEARAFDLHPLHAELFESGGLARGSWDIGFLVTDWFAEAERDHALLDLAPYLSTRPPEGYPEDWETSLLRFQQFGSSILGLPYHDGPECLIYRRDLFDDPEERRAFHQLTGRELNVPNTWEQFHQIARFFHRPEKGLWGTLFAAYPDGHNTVYDFCLQLWTRGGSLFDDSNLIRLDSPQAHDALAFYRSLLTDPLAMHPAARECDSVKSGFRYAAGEVAMMVNWFGFAAMSETLESSKIKGLTGIAPIPAGPNGDALSLNIYWTLGIGSGSPHAEIAYAFLRHCSSRAADRALTLGGGIGCRKSTWNDQEVNRMIPFYSRLESLHACARELPRLAYFPRLASIIDDLMVKTIADSTPVAELCAAAQLAAEQLE